MCQNCHNSVLAWLERYPFMKPTRQRYFSCLYCNWRGNDEVGYYSHKCVSCVVCREKKPARAKYCSNRCAVVAGRLKKAPNYDKTAQIRGSGGGSETTLEEVGIRTLTNPKGHVSRPDRGSWYRIVYGSQQPDYQ